MLSRFQGKSILNPIIKQQGRYFPVRLSCSLGREEGPETISTREADVAASAISKVKTVVELVAEDVVAKKTAHLPTTEGLKSMEERILRAVDQVKSEMKAEINQVRTEMKSDKAELKAEFHQTQTKSMQWLFGAVVVGAGGLAYRAGMLETPKKNVSEETKPSP